MDMAMRSFMFAGAVALVLAAALAGWWLFDRFGPDSAGPDQEDRVFVGDRVYDDREGSVRDEFGGSSSADDRITITSGEGLFSDEIFDRSEDRRDPPSSSSRFGSGPRFDWSGGSSSRETAPLPRETAADRVEADCRIRGGGSYACRCLVRLARRDLSAPEFEFLSLADEPEPRSERLNQAGIELTALTGLSFASSPSTPRPGNAAGRALRPEGGGAYCSRNSTSAPRHSAGLTSPAWATRTEWITARSRGARSPETASGGDNPAPRHRSATGSFAAGRDDRAGDRALRPWSAVRPAERA